MNKIVVTAMGQDRPGIVSAVTGILYRHRASIEDSTMTILEGNFAMIMIVAVPAQSGLKVFEKNFRQLESKMGLVISITRLKKKPHIGPFKHKGTPYILSVLGGDKPGIVHQVARFLARNGINITDLNTKVIGREGDKNAYAMVLEVEVPPSIQIPALECQLKELGRIIKVDIRFRPLNQLNL